MPKLKRKSYAQKQSTDTAAHRETRQDSVRRIEEQSADTAARQQARKNPVRRIEEQSADTAARQQARKNPVRRIEEQSADTAARQQARKNPVRRQEEQSANTAAHQQARKNPVRRQEEQSANTAAHQQARKNPVRRQEEQSADTAAHQQARKNPVRRQEEQSADTAAHQQARKNPVRRQEEQSANTEHRRGKRKLPQRKQSEEIQRKKLKDKMTSDYDRLLQSYQKAIQCSPSFICSCCGRLMYKTSTTKTSIKQLSSLGCSENVITAALHVHQEVHRLCGTCKNSIYNNRVPKLALNNGFDFPTIPPELKGLSPLEERLVSLRLPFMQIRLHGCERQSVLRGNIINVENDLNVCAAVLPRKFDETSTVQVQLMRRMVYKSPYMYETVRPLKVFQAAKYLMTTDAYKQENVILSDEWSRYREGETLSFVCSDLKSVVSDQDNVTSEELDGQELRDDKDEMETEIETCGADETLIFSEKETSTNFFGIRIAPAEGNTPIALHRDVNAEVLSFPTIYAGQPRKFREGITYTDIAKSEIQRYDRRACLPSHLLYAFKRSYNEKVVQAIQVCLRKTSKNQKLTANSARSLESIRNLIECDDGYAVFKHLRSSPSYWKNVSKKVMAMIRQIGKPAFFITFSAAETKWTELLRMLSKIVQNTDVSDEDLSGLPFEEIAELIRKDPVTCMRHFEHRLGALQKHILKSKKGVFAPYELVDYFNRLEFQMRGSPHSHGLYWIKNAPTFIEDDQDAVQYCVEFIDQFITTERCEEGKMEKIIGYQIHKHSQTCKKRSSKICRFGFPKPPLGATRILTPLPKDFDAQSRKNAEILFKKVKASLEEFGRNFKEDIEFPNFLDSLNTTYVDYIMALRTSIKRNTVFLKRSTNAIFINPYNRRLLEAWGANIDIQFVLDTYACAKYCVGYILKGEGGISKLLQALTQEVKRGNLNPREQLSKFARVLINGSEISAQEAAAFLMGTPNTGCSRQDIFINTAPPEERVTMLKPVKELEELADDSTEVCCKGLIDRYVCRPEELEDICLGTFASDYEFKKSPTTESKQSTSEEKNARADISESPVTRSSRTQNTIWYQLLDNSGSVRKRNISKVIRYRHYGKNEDLNNYCREQLMLYLPWRNEETELLSVDAVSQFNQYHDEIIHNSKPFIYNRDIDDHVLNDLLNEIDATDYNEDCSPLLDEDLERLTEEQCEFEDFSESIPKASRIEKFLPPKLVDEDEYFKLMRSLNEKQRKFVLNNLYLIKTNLLPFYTFLSGGAGVGKSHVITAMVQSCLRFFAKFSTTNPEQICVLVSAPTGKAAFNVFGMTLHCTFKLPPTQYGGRVCDLEEGTINSLRVKLEKTKLFIIDEISMVSVKQLYDIDQRLRQIYCTQIDFGGRSVLVVGHLRQLPPICGSFVFKPPRHIPLGELVGNHLWIKFQLYELDEIMRQRGEFEFCKALNNMSEGTMDQEDIALIQTREINDKLQPTIDAIRLFQTNIECEEFNKQMHDQLRGDGVMSTAYDKIQGNGSVFQKQTLKNFAKTLNRQQTDGLPYETFLKVGGEYFVSTNVDVQDGLFNGSTGNLKKIEYGTTAGNIRLPISAWIDFRNPLIGVEKKKRKKGSNPDWVSIERVTRNLSKTNRHGGMEIIRTQIPLIAANGMTIAKAQGSSMVNTVIKVISQVQGKRERKLTRENLYVACSRATSIKGLFIDGKFNPPAKPPENDPVSVEMRRLREIPFKFALKFLQDLDDSWEKIYFHNVQSFGLHCLDIAADQCCMASNVIALVEPHLIQSDSVAVPNFSCIHRSNCRSNRNSEGALVFKKMNVQISTPTIIKHFSPVGHCLFVIFTVTEVNVVMIYKSPAYSVDTFIEQLSYVLSRQNGNTVVFGDMNIDLQTVKGDNLIKMLRKYGYKSALDINLPTTDGLTHIDCCFSNCSKITAWTYESYFSYHKPICIVWPKE